MEGGVVGELEIYGSDAEFVDDPITIRVVHAADGRLDEMVVTTDSGEGEDAAFTDFTPLAPHAPRRHDPALGHGQRG